MVSTKLYDTVMGGSDPKDVNYSLETIKGLLGEFKAMAYGEQGAAAFEEFFDSTLDKQVSFTEFTSAFIFVQRASGYPNKA
ncbi:hypothetical protein BDV32DRAFT_141871 [Aspergillus pseudonomiae]|nr:hypothetical protein BDV32DRAFT_141871 [Aspergillus pseudonomiae]